MRSRSAHLDFLQRVVANSHHKGAFSLANVESWIERLSGIDDDISPCDHVLTGHYV